MTCCTKNTLQPLSWKLSSQSLCQDVVLHTKVRVPRKRSSSLEVAAIDAAQSFDYESLRMEELQSGNKLKIGIVGFGNFGQFLAQRMISQGHKVLAYSRTDYKDVAHTMGVPFFRYGSEFIGTVDDIWAIWAHLCRFQGGWFGATVNPACSEWWSSKECAGTSKVHWGEVVRSMLKATHCYIHCLFSKVLNVGPNTHQHNTKLFCLCNSCTDLALTLHTPFKMAGMLMISVRNIQK